MTADAFFDEQTEQSEVKARIVSKYFNAWSGVMLANRRTYGHFDRIGYIDLFAGPGRYKDGAASTPLMVIERAATVPALADALVSMFNDKEEGNARTLAQTIAETQGFNALRHKPQVFCSEVGETAQQMFRSVSGCPTFSFIDPFGYKGLSRGIIQTAVREWGCDCVFFFNYSRINAGISNPIVRAHMDALFGQTRADRMRDIVSTMGPVDREAFILEELAGALRDLGTKFVLPFRFRSPSGARTSHALVFVTKHLLGYEIMKGIMAGESSTEDQGVPSFTYSPADARCPLLFSLNRPLSALKEALLERFAGQILKMEEIYNRHHVDTPYIEKNYKKVLADLEVEGRITANPPAGRRRMRGNERTFGPNVMVTFPRRQ